MPGNWIDFKKVKERVLFEDVLRRYDMHFSVKRSGRGLPAGRQELYGLCPFHKDTKPSFSVNPEKGVFFCFGCKAAGDVFAFVSRMEGVTVSDAARRLAEWFGIQDTLLEKPARARGERRTAAPAAAEANGPRPSAGEETAKETELAEEKKDESGVPTREAGLRPLSFALKVDSSHPYIAERGISSEVANHFGIGFVSRGLQGGRIVIPLHDFDGQLVGYLGRWPGDEGIPEGEGKYKIPPGLSISRLVFNLHRVKEEEHLVLVEGVWSVFRLHSLGIWAVALLGSSLSGEQEELLSRSAAKRITIMMDGDEAGRAGATDILPRLARRFFVRLVPLSDGTQPDKESDVSLRAFLAV